MKIQEITRRLIIDELIMHGCITGQMSVSDFVQRVYPKAREMPTTDWRFGMKTAIDDIYICRWNETRKQARLNQRE